MFLNNLLRASHDLNLKPSTPLINYLTALRLTIPPRLMLLCNRPFQDGKQCCLFLSVNPYCFSYVSKTLERHRFLSSRCATSVLQFRPTVIRVLLIWVFYLSLNFITKWFVAVVVLQNPSVGEQTNFSWYSTNSLCLKILFAWKFYVQNSQHTILRQRDCK